MKDFTTEEISSILSALYFRKNDIAKRYEDSNDDKYDYAEDIRYYDSLILKILNAIRG